VGHLLKGGSPREGGSLLENKHNRFIFYSSHYGTFLNSIIRWVSHPYWATIKTHLWHSGFISQKNFLSGHAAVGLFDQQPKLPPYKMLPVKRMAANHNGQLWKTILNRGFYLGWLRWLVKTHNDGLRDSWIITVQKKKTKKVKLSK
jgi:hypothetical protein